MKNDKIYITADNNSLLVKSCMTPYSIDYRKMSWRYTFISIFAYLFLPIFVPIMILISKLFKVEVKFFPVREL